MAKSSKSTTSSQSEETEGSVEQKVEEIHDRVVTKTQAEVNGLFEILGSYRRLLWINFLSGLSRGVGFFLGMTLIGGAIIGLGAYVLDKAAATMGIETFSTESIVRPIYGKYQEIKDILDSEMADKATDEKNVDH